MNEIGYRQLFVRESSQFIQKIVRAKKKNRKQTQDKVKEISCFDQKVLRNPREIFPSAGVK